MSQSINTSFIKETLSKAIEWGASDIHITEDKRPVMRIEGKLTEVSHLEPWSNVHIAAFLKVLKLDEVWKDDMKSVNSSFSTSGKRFRFHGFRSFTGRSISMRVIPLDVPQFEGLYIPEIVKKLAYKESGLVLVTGPTGSGKTTTLASLINDVNNNADESKLVVTVEDPVEFVFSEVNSRIVQREVGRDVNNFEDAVKDAMREDPDIIMIGELQDRETIRNAITLAETGHLVMGSLHSNGAADTFDRIIDAFPGDQQGQVRTQLANSLQGIIHQRLIPKIDGGRVPLTEILLLDDPDIRRSVRGDSSVHALNTLMKEKFAKTGMMNVERSAAMLVQKGLIDMETAVRVSRAKKEDLNRIINTLR